MLSFMTITLPILLSSKIIVLKKTVDISFSIHPSIHSSSFIGSYFFTMSANERPPPHTVLGAGADAVAPPLKFSDSGLDERLDLSSELESSVLIVPTVAFPEVKFARPSFFCKK
jgi:hypothetical protein